MGSATGLSLSSLLNESKTKRLFLAMPKERIFEIPSKTSPRSALGSSRAKSVSDDGSSQHTAWLRGRLGFHFQRQPAQADNLDWLTRLNRNPTDRIPILALNKNFAAAGIDPAQGGNGFAQHGFLPAAHGQELGAQSGADDENEKCRGDQGRRDNIGQ